MNANRQDDTLIFNIGNMLSFDSFFVCLTTGETHKETEYYRFGWKADANLRKQFCESGISV